MTTITMAVIHADQSHDYLLQKLAAGKIEPLGPIADATPDTIEGTTAVSA